MLPVLLIPTAAGSASTLRTTVLNQAETVALAADADTYLRAGAPDTNEGASTFLRLRASGDNRSLVRFDQAAIAGAVGPGTLTSARLELQITQNGNNWGTTGRTISVYRLTSSWAEGNGFVDQGSPPNRGSGAGATWACAIDADISDQGKDCAGATEWEMGQPNQPQLHPWVEPATASALITNGLTGTVAFDVTADVQAYLSGSAQNSGWIVKKDLEGPPGLVQFASRETGDGPQLVLTIESGDETSPLVAPASLSLLDPPGDYVNGQGSYAVELLAEDQGSGVARVSLERAGTEVAFADASCGTGCPESFNPTLSFDASSLAEGGHGLLAKARDDAGNLGQSEPWTLFVDRTAPGVVADLRIVGYDTASQTATVGWEEGAGDPLLQDGSQGSGVFQFEIRIRRQGGEWTTDYTDVRDYDLDAAALGEIVEVEIRAIDGVGNIGLPASATLTVFDAGEYVPWYSDPQEDPGTEVTLTAEQRQQAIDAVLSDPRMQALLAGRQVTVDDVAPWSWQGTQGSVFGAQVTLALDSGTTFESDWPVLDWAEDLSSYSSDSVHFRATGVTKLLTLARFDEGLVSYQPYDGAIDPESISIPAGARAAAGRFAPSSHGPLSSPPSEEGIEWPRNAINVRILDRRLVPEAVPDRFWNWDFRSDRYPPSQLEAAKEADWPVAVVFRENATLNDAKSLWGGRRFISPMKGFVHDRRPHPDGHTAPSVIVRDPDKGAYTGSVCGTKHHFRLYAPEPAVGGDDRMFNVEWGFYVVGTAHEDIAECVGYLKWARPEFWLVADEIKVHGCTECTMDELARAAIQRGWPTEENLVDFHNRDNRGRVGNRWHVNDGFATRICIVGDDPCFSE